METLKTFYISGHNFPSSKNEKKKNHCEKISYISEMEKIS